MKPNELRIGNTLTSKTWLGYHRVDGIERIDDEIFEVKTKGYVHRHEKGTWFELAPIPLTEELLLKCGFELRIDSPLRTSYTRHKPYLEYTFPKMNTAHKLGLLFGNRHFDILYLHQLQNLFFSLTGEELEIKL